MFDFCPQIGKACGFATKSNFNPDTGKKGEITEVFCGEASGYDTRQKNLPRCWKDMSKPEKAKHSKQIQNNFLKLKILGKR